jgi:cytochrome c-type biogenesis protein CcmI
MDLTLGILISLAAILFTFYPIMARVKSKQGADRLHRNKESLQFDLENLQIHLRELEFDYNMGNLEAADYEDSKQEIAQQIAILTEKLNGRKSGDKSLRCSQCGAEVQAQDKFCGSCGHPLK